MIRTDQELLKFLQEIFIRIQRKLVQLFWTYRSELRTLNYLLGQDIHHEKPMRSKNLFVLKMLQDEVLLEG